jgi:hypothetical protein
MTPEISEFSYGFALTNEIVGWAPVAAAPLFPSLIEEGKAGGGYDVHLDIAGIALYLQFKRADCMVRATAREISEYKLPIDLPFFRFKITERRKSDQHELLLALNQTNQFVYYAAPKFHELSEINAAWHSNSVGARSIFISPQEVGALDDESHHVAYDEVQAWLCSEPKEIAFHGANQLIGQIESHLKTDSRPFRTKIPEIIRNAESAKRIAEERIAEKRASKIVGEHVADELVEGRAPERVIRRTEGRVPEKSIPSRRSRPLSDTEQALRNLADDAARIFNAQLIIAQPRD